MKVIAKNTLSLVLVLLGVRAGLGRPEEQSVSGGFIPPAAPSRTARPDPTLPRLGRDKHGLPFYHPSQVNRVVRTTAYTHSESDHRRYGARSAAGEPLKYTNQVRSAAADWSVYPLGTRFRIKGEPYTYVIDDYGSALVGTGTIDIYQPSKELMRKWGVRVVEIQVLRWGSSKASMRMLAGRVRSSHCAKMQAALREQSRHRSNVR